MTLHAYVEDDGVLLAICGGFQILGHEWLLGEEVVKGLGLVDMTTERAPGGSGNRLIGNIALRSPLADQAVVGYENHAGRTHLGTGVEAFGDVASSTGHGQQRQRQARRACATRTWWHLPARPAVAEEPAGGRRPAHPRARTPRTAGRRAAPELAPLDDAVENAANEYVRNRLNAG